MLYYNKRVLRFKNDAVFYEDITLIDTILLILYGTVPTRTHSYKKFGYNEQVILRSLRVRYNEVLLKFKITHHNFTQF